MLDHTDTVPAVRKLFKTDRKAAVRACLANLAVAQKESTAMHTLSLPILHAAAALLSKLRPLMLNECHIEKGEVTITLVKIDPAMPEGAARWAAALNGIMIDDSELVLDMADKALDILEREVGEAIEAAEAPLADADFEQPASPPALTTDRSRSRDRQKAGPRALGGRSVDAAERTNRRGW